MCAPPVSSLSELFLRKYSSTEPNFLMKKKDIYVAYSQCLLATVELAARYHIDMSSKTAALLCSIFLSSCQVIGHRSLNLHSQDVLLVSS